METSIDATPMAQRAERGAKGKKIGGSKGATIKLGIFQFMVLNAVQLSRDGAYVAEIQRKIENVYGRLMRGMKLDAAQVHVSASRLEELECLVSELAKHPENKARPVRIYRITKQGLEELAQMRSVFESLSMESEHAKDESDKRNT